jgi:DivIVA domain-containing protein
MKDSDHQVSLYYRTPASIRDETFQRRMRGLDADEVYEYLDVLADQVEATERELGESRAENERLQAELRRVQVELDEYEHVGDRVSEQAVQLFSQAQLVAEQMVEDISRDARERIGQARARAQDRRGRHEHGRAARAFVCPLGSGTDAVDHGIVRHRGRPTRVLIAAR